MTLATWHTRGRILINTLLTQKLHQVAIVCAAACFALATPAVQAAETSADAGIIAPDEPDDDSFTAGVPSAGEDSEARAIFQAWKRLDTGLTASIGVAVPSRVMEFLAHKITSNVRELEGALNRLIAWANLFGRPITLEGAQEVLHDILRAHDRRVTIEEIQRKVAEHYNIRLTDMSSARRASSLPAATSVRARPGKAMVTSEPPVLSSSAMGRRRLEGGRSGWRGCAFSCG